MKKLSLIICIFLLAIDSQSQIIPRTIEKCNLEDLQLKRNNSQVLKIGENVTKLIAVFGEPASQEPFYYEMEEILATLYKYNSNKIFYVAGKFDAWEIHDSTISIGKSNKFFTVGDPASKVFEVFPEHQQDHTKGYIKIPLRSIDYDMECTNLIISVDNGVVSKIIRYDC